MVKLHCEVKIGFIPSRVPPSKTHITSRFPEVSTGTRCTGQQSDRALAGPTGGRATQEKVRRIFGDGCDHVLFDIPEQTEARKRFRATFDALGETRPQAAARLVTEAARWMGQNNEVRLGLGRIVASHCRSSTSYPVSLTYSVPLFLRRQCDRNPRCC